MLITLWTFQKFQTSYLFILHWYPASAVSEQYCVSPNTEIAVWYQKWKFYFCSLDNAWWIWKHVDSRTHCESGKVLWEYLSFKISMVMDFHFAIWKHSQKFIGCIDHLVSIDGNMFAICLERLLFAVTSSGKLDHFLSCQKVFDSHLMFWSTCQLGDFFPN